MENAICKRGDRYEVGLMWKSDAVDLPENYKMAHRRLQSLERSLDPDPKKAAAYTETLMGYVARGHARKVTCVTRRSSMSATGPSALASWPLVTARGNAYRI